MTFSKNLPHYLHKTLQDRQNRVRSQSDMFGEGEIDDFALKIGIREGMPIP